MKKILIVFSIITLILLLAGCITKETVVNNQNPPMMDNSPKNGRVVFSMTDAAADMGSVSEVRVTVDSVMVHSNAQGWVKVSDTARTYDLLKLKAENSQKIIADAQLKEGTYDQIRLDISKVVVVDKTGEHEAKLPSNEIKMMGTLDVKANSTASASFDFVADESLHVTGNGAYIMAPVIKLETRSNANVYVNSNNEVEVSGGRTLTNVKVGVTLDGDVGEGLGIAKDLKLSIKNGKIMQEGKVMAKTGLGRAVFTITDAAANMNGVTRVKVTIDSIRVHSNSEGWVTVTTGPKTYDLLEMKENGNNYLLANVNLATGIYEQVRLDISSVVVTDSSGNHEAKLPSNEVKIVGNLVINENMTSTESFDFIADESLHMSQGNTSYIFAPVIKFETRENTQVDTSSSSNIRINNGRVTTDIKVGMDILGNVGIGIKIPNDARLSVSGSVISRLSI